jgi:hypothetical protein
MTVGPQHERAPSFRVFLTASAARVGDAGEAFSPHEGSLYTQSLRTYPSLPKVHVHTYAIYIQYNVLDLVQYSYFPSDNRERGSEHKIQLSATSLLLLRSL